MQNNPSYQNVVDDICLYLKTKSDICLNKGTNKDNIIIDPGFGFGKTLEHNYLILNSLKKFSDLGYRVLSGISRKSMIGDVLNVCPSDRLYGTLAASVIAVKNYTNILRVHDVRETKMLLNFKDLIINRQGLTPVYFFDGSLYISTTKSFKKEKEFYHENTHGIILNGNKSPEIDEEVDFKIVELFLNQK